MISKALKRIWRLTHQIGTTLELRTKKHVWSHQSDVLTEAYNGGVGLEGNRRDANRQGIRLSLSKLSLSSLLALDSSPRIHMWLFLP